MFGVTFNLHTRLVSGSAHDVENITTVVESIVDSLDAVGAVDPSVGSDASDPDVLGLRIEFVIEGTKNPRVASDVAVGLLAGALDMAGIPYEVGESVTPQVELLASA